jgi:hypothetical protein
MIPHNDLQLTLKFKSDKEISKLPAEDDDIAFLVQVYKDKYLAINCLESIRANYKLSRIILVVDGDDDPDWIDIANKYRAESKIRERLYLLPKIGEMAKRNFEYFIEKPAKFLIKLDTDSLVHRRFKYMPNADFFGSLAYLPDGSFNHVAGGCIGVSRSAAERMLKDNFFDDPKLSSVIPDWISRCSKTHWEEWCLKEGRGSYDCMLSHVCARHRIKAEVFEEVYSSWWPVPKSARSLYAVTHPHKF